jgi:hypothetical protein
MKLNQENTLRRRIKLIKQHACTRQDRLKIKNENIYKTW